MTTKDKVVQAVQELPEDATFEDAVERLVFIAKIEEGLRQADAGDTLSTNELKQRLGKWLK